MRVQVVAADPEISGETGSVEMARDLTQWLEAAQQQHPALTAARFQLEASRQKLVAVRSEGLPTLEFNQSYFVNGRPNQGGAGTRTREAVTGVSLNIPVFDGFSSTYKLRDAQAQIDIREAELMETQDQVLGELAKAHAEAKAALRTLASSLQLQESAIQSLENVQRKYDRGLIDILDVLNAQAALVDARQERIRTVAEWRSARLRLLVSAGEIGRTRIAEQGR
jgi:outer membrane protein